MRQWAIRRRLPTTVARHGGVADKPSGSRARVESGRSAPAPGRGCARHPRRRLARRSALGRGSRLRDRGGQSHRFARRHRLAASRRLLRSRPPQHQQLADLLNRGAIERRASVREQRLALGPIVGEDAHLDELMRRQGDVGLVQNRGRQSVVPDRHDRAQVMCACPECSPKRGQERFHRSIIVVGAVSAVPRAASPEARRAETKSLTSRLNPSGKKHRFV